LIQAIEPREQSPAYRAIITRDGWKFACTAEGPWLMFNLRDDPFEMNNLAQVPSAGGIRQSLRERLVQKLSSVGDGFVVPEFARTI